MADKLVVDRSGRAKEYRDLSYQPQHPVIRAVAKLISYVFHPLFIPVLIAWFLITVQPHLFSSFSASRKIIVVIQFFLMYSFFPLVTVLLAKALGFLESIYLRTQKERVIPYIACNIYYFWMCYVLRHQPEFPGEVVQLAMAIFIASSAGLLANIYMKVSMHAMSMGILVIFTGVLAMTQSANYTVYSSLAVLIAGLVCTARLIVSDHTQKEIYTGLMIGVCSMIAGVWADGILP